LIRYVPHIKDEKENIKKIIIGVPQYFREKINFDKPNTIEETIGKARHCYEQSKHKSEPHKD
jgi:hypothetical protein